MDATRCIRWASGTVLSATLMLWGNAAVAGVIYSDRTLFEAALSSFTTETFESAPLSGTVGSGAASQIVFDDFTVSTSPDATKVINTAAFGAMNTTPAGSRYLYIDTDIGNSGYSATFTLDVATGVFGFDYTGNNNPNNALSVMVDGQLIGIPNASPPSAAFFGYIADPGTVFSTVTFSATTNSAQGIDQVTFLGVAASSSAPAPEPGTLLMLGLGLVGLGVARRRIAT